MAKLFRFLRAQGDIVVDYMSTNKNPADLNENFVVKRPTNIDNYVETKLFYLFDAKPWTLNEMIFFITNNKMCLRIYDEDAKLVAKYGNYCDDGAGKIFDQSFDFSFE